MIKKYLLKNYLQIRGVNMDKTTCLNLLREIKSVSFATVDENGNPQVRIIDVMNVENNKLYFLTARGKEFYKQLIETKKVAIVGLTKNWETIRLNGEVKHLKNQKDEIDKIFKLNPVMNNVYPNESRYILEAFCIEKGEIEYFNLSKEPIYRKSFSLDKTTTKKGYYITDDCINCGICVNCCPQNAVISTDKNMQIQQEHCLHCGLCYERCPVNAIGRLSDDT